MKRACIEDLRRIEGAQTIRRPQDALERRVFMDALRAAGAFGPFRTGDDGARLVAEPMSVREGDVREGDPDYDWDADGRLFCYLAPEDLGEDTFNMTGLRGAEKACTPACEYYVYIVSHPHNCNDSYRSEYCFTCPANPHSDQDQFGRVGGQPFFWPRKLPAAT